MIRNTFWNTAEVAVDSMDGVNFKGIQNDWFKHGT